MLGSDGEGEGVKETEAGDGLQPNTKKCSNNRKRGCKDGGREGEGGGNEGTMEDDAAAEAEEADVDEADEDDEEEEEEVEEAAVEAEDDEV